MKLTYHNDIPGINYYTIHNCFGKKINKEILDEAESLKDQFTFSVTGKGQDTNFRSNTVSYYDNIYELNRNQSVLLSNIDGMFSNSKFSEPLISTPYPFNMFPATNYHETQVSRYGDNGQKYNFHSDSGINKGLDRLITLVYYFNEEPKRWSGGELEFINSPIYDGKAISDKYDKVTIEPVNDLAVVFPSYLAHRVRPTKSPRDFRSGRFSVNCWIGMK